MTYLLHELLRNSAERDPAQEAVRCASRSLTYGELEASSNAIAQALVAAGVMRGDRVAIHMPKRIEVLACIYGALKAGAAYVPLDPRAPISRVSVVANDCTVAALLSTPKLAARLVPLLKMPPKLVLVTEEESADIGRPVARYEEVTADRHATDPDVPVIDADLAYILYTSGSTGLPKGVMLSHRNALAFVEWCASTIGVSSHDRLANHAPMHFDLSVFDLYLSALGGATVVLIRERDAFFGAALARIIDEERISIWYSVPSALRLLTKAIPGPGSHPSLRTVVFAGEVFPTPALRELRRLLPDVALWNLYGPTETNVCTYLKVEQLPPDEQTIPIGRACRNTEVFALTSSGRPAGVGTPGELHVRGPTVMKGYWGQPEKTAEVLMPGPLPHQPSDVVYRTGDIVKPRPDGGYDLVGRRDHQIKSRGYRIELGEVEAALALHPDLEEWVVVAVPHEDWGNALVAWVAPRDSTVITEGELKEHVAARLPNYMVPTVVRIVDEIPKTSSGKIDRPLLTERATDSSVVADD